MNQELSSFIEEWHEDKNGIKPLFVAACGALENMDQVDLSFKDRPGISYSVRAKHKNQKERDLFVLIDVIDDEPDARWLSVCFYADLVTDPDGYGDIVPGGLAGEDACCFDIENSDGKSTFLLDKLAEAAKNAR